MIVNIMELLLKYYTGMKIFFIACGFNVFYDHATCAKLCSIFRDFRLIVNQHLINVVLVWVLLKLHSYLLIAFIVLSIFEASLICVRST